MTATTPAAPVRTGNTPTSAIHVGSARSRIVSTSKGERPPAKRPRPTSTQSDGDSGRSATPTTRSTVGTENPASNATSAVRSGR